MPRRVLVADDSPAARVVIVRRLRAAGHDLEVVERDSTASASTVDGSLLACALLDLDLGDGFGTDVAERLRASASALPIAFFTSETGGALVDRARAFGPVFAKPEALDEAIAWIVSRA